METDRHVDAILGDVRDLAGDPESEAATERLLRALAPSLRLRLMDVVGEAAVELSAEIPDGHVEVRLAGRDAQLVYVGDTAPEQPAGLPVDDEGTARLTLRIPEGLKSRVEAAAASDGVSVNQWLVRTIGRGLEGGGRRRASGSRLTGFAQA